MTDPDLKYMFSISAPFAARWLGKTPAGYRIDLDYDSNLARGGAKNPKAQVATDYTKLFKSWPATEALMKAQVAKIAPARQAELKTLAGEIAENPKQEAEILAQLQRDEARRLLDNTEDESAWLGLAGELASGMDWAVLRPDGVVDFDGRLTLKDEQERLINAVVLGSVDMVKAGQPRPITLDQAAGQLTARKQEEITFALAFRFEAAQPPEPWAARRYRETGSGAMRYRKLSQGQFLGAGVLKSLGDTNSSFHIDVFYVEPPKLQLSELDARAYVHARHSR